MPARLALGTAAIIVACGKPGHELPIDAGHELPDATDVAIDASVVDATPNAPPDAWEPDTRPPSLASVTPGSGSAVWLHAPIRLVFDEPLDPTKVLLTAAVQIGGTPIAAQIAFEPPSTLAIKLPANTRGVGALDVDVTGSVADLAGNTYAMPIDLSFLLPAWSAVGVDRGYASSAPELAVTSDGRVYAAWLVGAVGSRRVAVSELVANTWRSLGGTLGSSDVTSAAVAIDDDGSVLVAWSEGGQAHVARWTSQWSALPSPGAADSVALAAPASGAAMLALFASASAGVRTFDGTAWQPIGMDLALAAPIASSPSLVACADGKPAIGWIDTENQLRVYRYDASWTAIAPIAVTAGSRMSLAARGTTVAIAWDQFAASFGVLAAQASGVATTWTRLGRTLDIDIAGDAIAPAIAFDAGGAPIVAWTELVETKQRGAVARWTGSAWSITGGISWLDDTASTPLRSKLALHAGESPVVATSAGGVMRLARLNGPRIATTGIAQRASISGCSFDAANPPAALSQTGCFTVPSAGKPSAHAGLVPFDVVSELWSDGAKKRRWIGLPDGTSLTNGGNGAWVAPVGTIMVKEFAIETTPGNPATRRVMETRFFVNDAALGWQGFSYRWNAAGTDASLLNDGQFTFYWPMDDGSLHAHVYPSRAHCRSCHHASFGPLLGLRTEQLARWFDYDGVVADQLATLAAINVGPATSAAPLLSPHDPSETAERRMRGYMHANCAHCHNPQYLSIKDLRVTTPLASTRLCETITPGSPSTSKVYQLVTSRPGMPALGTAAVDPLADQLLGAWISGMTTCP